MILGISMMTAAYGTYAAFWIRFFAHLRVLWRAGRQLSPGPVAVSRGVVWLLTIRDVALFWRLLKANPPLWFGEWVFHLSFLLVILRHLRYFLNPVPLWVWDLQVPGLIAGYILPLALLYILVIRLLTAREKYSSPANLLLLALLLMISTLGVAMHGFFKPNLVDVKLFAFGIMTFSPAAFPDSLLFLLHFVLVLVFVLLVPTHIIAAPFVMWEARKRDLGLKLVMHDGEKQQG